MNQRSRRVIGRSGAVSCAWAAIRALGNRLRHEYDAIREDRLWDIVKIDLPALCDACEDALRRFQAEQKDIP